MYLCTIHDKLLCSLVLSQWQYQAILLGLFGLRCGAVYVFLSYTVGKFYIVGKTLWGCKRSAPQCKILLKKIPTMLVLSLKKNIPHSAKWKISMKNLMLWGMHFNKLSPNLSYKISDLR